MRLVALREELPPAFGVDDVRAAGVSPSLLTDAWRFLHAVYTDVPFLQLDFDRMGLPDLCAMILATDGDYADEAFEAFVLHTAHPVLFQSLGSVLDIIASGDVHRLVLAGLSRSDPSEVKLTLYFIQAAYGGRYRLRLSAKQRDELKAAVQSLKQRKDPALEAILSQWVLPAVH